MDLGNPATQGFDPGDVAGMNGDETHGPGTFGIDPFEQLGDKEM